MIGTAIRRAGAIVLAWVAAYSGAVEVENLYVGRALVTSQERHAFDLGARDAMRAVLVRVSGDSTVTLNERIRRALDAPHEYYSQFSYESSEQEFQLGSERLPAQMLEIHFEPNAIAGLLREAGYRVWGSNRPSVLIWLVVEMESGRAILKEDDQNSIMTALAEDAARRGLPIIFPILDLEDDRSISPATIWGRFLDEIKTASARYRPDSILTGRVFQGRDGAWQAGWAYRIDEDWEEYDAIELRPQDLITDALDRLADELAARYSIASARQQFFLRVEAVESLEDYVRLHEYLTGLAPVLDATVAEVDGNEILVRLRTEANADQLNDLIALDEKLLLIASGVPGERETLYYRWLR